MALPPFLPKWLLEEQQQGLLLHPLALLSFFLLSLLFLLGLSRVRSQKPNLPPSPPRIPIIGNLHQLGALIHRSFRDLSRKYGPIMLLHLGHTPVLVISSAEMAREIMKNQDSVFTNRPAITAAKMLLYGCSDVGFAPYGEYWRQVRKICVLDLLGIKRVQSFKFIREEEVACMIEKISHSCSLGSPINLSEMLLSLSNNVVSRCTFGRKFEKGNGRNRFGKLSKEVMHLLGALSIGDFFPSLRWMDVLTGLVGRLKRTSQELDVSFDGIIDEHLIKRDIHNDPDNKKDFMGLLLHAQREKKLDINITEDNIKAIATDMFVGGTDTTATAMEWAVAELLKSPTKMKKAQEEVRNIVGKKSKVHEEDIQQMDYLKCVIKETLRLHSPVPLLVPRESVTSTHIKGYLIPPKTRVYVNAWAIQRDNKVWERAEEFSPERFNRSIIDFKGQDFEFVPFGSGRRNCPGMSFGIAVVELTLANLLYWFDWELPRGEIKEELDMNEVFGLTVNKKIPLHLLPRRQIT